MNKVNKGLIVVVILLTILVLCLGGYIVYDKVLKNDNSVSDNEDAKENDNNVSDNKVGNIDDTNQNDDRIALNQIEALQIVRDITKKYEEYKSSLGPYCGEFDSEDYISFGSYETNDFRDYNASKKFNSINGIEEYYKSFMVEELIPTYLKDGVSYLEQDNKLYCRLSHKGPDSYYDEEKSEFFILTNNENEIVTDVVIANVVVDYTSYSVGTITVIKDSKGNWLISEYNVEYVDFDS